MNPEFLKKLQEITAALRGGLTANPLDELQKRATQFGEGVGYQMEHNAAQAGYAKAHPESTRAQAEMLANAATTALQLGKGEKPILVPAIKTAEGKIVDGITHAHAYMEAGITEPLPSKNEGYSDPQGKFYTRQAAEKLMKAWMSPSVKAQVAERSRQAGKEMGITTEDLNGKLYKNYGTKADAPITGRGSDLSDEERVAAARERQKKIWDSLDSAGTTLVRPVTPELKAAASQKFSEFLNAAHEIATKAPRGADNKLSPEHADAYWGAMNAALHLMSPKDATLTQKLVDFPITKSTPQELPSQEFKALPPGLDSVISKLPAALRGKDFKNDVDKRIRGALFEQSLRAERAARKAESNAAQAANAQDYNLDKDSKAALRRGDKQRRTGIAQDSVVSLGSRLHDALTKNGGFTIDPQTGADLTSGYSVGGGEKSGVLLKKPLTDLKPNELEAFLAANKHKLLPGQAWGGWVDNGQVYAEPADQVSDLNAAQRLGNERGEKAIWDHANKAEIPLKAAKTEAASAAADEFANILKKWHSIWTDYQTDANEAKSLHTDRRKSLADALRNPQP